ncbi:6061_t:CDS:1, partial [Racocetra fulgida]
MLLSATHLSLPTFTAATALSLFKLMIHVWIGTKISSFSAFSSHLGLISGEIDNTTTKPPLSKSDNFARYFHFIIMLCSIAIAIGIIIYVWILARRVIKEVEDENGEYMWLDAYDVNEIGDNVTLLGTGEMRYRRNSIAFCDEVEDDSNINIKPINNNLFNEKDSSIQIQ